MQKLIWKNANDEEIDLTSGNYGITEWNGFSNVDLNIQSQQVPFQDGSVFLDALIGDRQLSVTLAMNDKNDLETRYRLRRELIHKLNPKLGEGYLIYTNDFISKRIKCISKIPLFPTKNSNTGGTPKASLSWTACDPYWEDLEETVVEMVYGERKIIENEGDAETNPIIELFGNSQNTEIENITTNKRIIVEGLLPTNCKINTQMGEKSVTGTLPAYKTSEYGSGIKTMFYSEKYKSLIICGENELILLSKDGINSEQKHIVQDFYFSSTSGPSIYGGCYSPVLDLFVFISTDAYKSRYLVTEDFENWTYINSTDESLRGIVWSDDLNTFIAIGQKNIYTSTDALNWTSIMTLDTDVCYKILIVNDSVYVSISNNKILKSGDLETWETLSTPADAISNYLFYEQNKFIMTGTNKIYFSYDFAETWTSVTIDLSNIRNIIYLPNKNLFLASNYSNDDYNGLYASYDLQNFRKVLDVFVGVLYFFKEESIIIGYEVSKKYISFDGLEWTLKTNGLNAVYNPTKYNFLAMYFNKKINKILAISQLNRYVGNSISDMTNEAASVWGSGRNVNGIAYSDSLHRLVYIIGTSTERQIYRTDDGINYTLCYQDNKPALYKIKNINNKFIAIPLRNDNKILVSDDAVNWEEKTVTLGVSSCYYIDITFDGTYYYLFYCLPLYQSYYAKSTDLETWTNIPINLVPTPVSNVQTTVNYIKETGIFLALIGEDRILKSVDGINWDYIQSGNSIIYYPDYKFYILTGNGGKILYTYDLISWNEIKSGSTINYYGSAIIKDKIYCYGSFLIISEFDFSKIQNQIQNLTSDSNIDLYLGVGENLLSISNTSGSCKARITYRQKYIGV